MICTRFAPSPTGYLHIGSVRTALYCWLFAKKNGGKFILRIEDTDLERSTQEAVDIILDGMAWLGLTWDEGPYYQTARFDRYRAVINELIETGHAYKCYCSKDRLEKLREMQMLKKVKPKYDYRCRHVAPANTAPDAPYVIRFKNPLEGFVTIEDAIKGKIEIANDELDDLVLARTDGSPTYNLSVVVDDWDMGVTHVLRGDDHINNTPRQMNIFHALGAKPPIYGHLPMILALDGKKLSKRHGAASVLEYKDDGILPHALLNYLARLGWSHGDQEIFSIEELISFFDTNRINAAPAAFNPEKLLWLNQHYIKTMAVDELVPHVTYQFDKLGLDLNQGPTLVDLITVQKDRVKTLKEMAEKSACFYTELVYEPIAKEKFLNANAKNILQTVYDNLTKLQDWIKESLHACVQQTMKDMSIKMPELAQPLRVAVIGDTTSPSIDSTLVLLGREKTLTRLKYSIQQISGEEGQAQESLKMS